MDEQDLHLWGNLFRSFEAEIQPLLNLIMTTIQVIYVDQGGWAWGGQETHSISGEVHVPE